MHTKVLFCIFLVQFCAINAAIIVWSNKKVEISPLLPFDDGDLENLVKKLDVKRVFLFKVKLNNRNAQVPKNLKDVIDPFYSAFNPNGNVGTANATEISLSEDCNGLDINKIRSVTGPLTNSSDFLCLLDITYSKSKRSVNAPTTDDKVPEKTFSEKGFVIYIGQFLKTNQYAMLYSSKSLKLEMQDSTVYLGNTDDSLITVDNKKFNIPIPLEGKGKVILRFPIQWIGGYWYFQSVKVEIIADTNKEKPMINLTTDENIMAPAHFSYHCNGRSVFSDPKTGTNLTIYDLQVQVDARNRRFGDANDCVPFTTAPIWSGLFVTTILGLGLIVAVTAIMDIKTMDKFDNSNSKNLCITVSE